MKAPIDAAEIVPAPMSMQKRGKDVVAVPGIEMPILTAEEVRDALERTWSTTAPWKPIRF